MSLPEPFSSSAVLAGLALAVAAVLLTGCTAPIGAERVSTQQAFAQVEATALRTGKPSADTVSTLHRFGLDRLAAQQPDEAVRQLHEKALAGGERDLLFALAELSYVAADRVRRSVKSWDPRDARDFYLGSAAYAWLFLFGEGQEPPPGPYDRRFRRACDFYNYSLGLALTTRRTTNGAVQLVEGRRRLPVGEIELQVAPSERTSRFLQTEQILLADQFRVRGLSVRNRQAGLGAPVIGLWPAAKSDLTIRRATPATVVLRWPARLAELGTAGQVATIEVYSPYHDSDVAIGSVRVPLEADLTTYRAYTLNQSTIWKLGRMQFLAPAERVPSQLILNQTYEPDRIPVVLVHGTFSSPVTWAEMANTLMADPVLRRRYQVWTFIYGSGNPLVYSMADFRSALQTKIQEIDPEATNATLRRMVVIGHSQGGLLTKATAVDSGDRLWRTLSTRQLDSLDLSEADRVEARRVLFYEPLPFVERVVFIATPHRGSYLSSGLARRLAHRFVSLPAGLVSRGTNLLHFTRGSETGRFLKGRMPTSLDGMSPKNPGLLALADLPVAPRIKAHSIVAIDGDEQPPEGRDGLVTYRSAHVDYAESECIVRSFHSCLKHPATIEEVRRILHEHLRPRLLSEPITTNSPPG